MNTFHKILFVLAIFIANCISASAIEFTVDGVRYSVNNDNKTVTVAGYPSGSKPTGDLTIPESVTFGGISFPVTSIGRSAFSGCSGLTSVTIPNSVTSIDTYAFVGCYGLTSVIIPNSVTSIGAWAFEYCKGLTSVTIGNSVTKIGSSAFYNCSGLTSVTIPNSVTSIGYDAFSGTAWYNNQPDGLVYAGRVAYKYKGTMPSGTCIVLKEGTIGITESAFSGYSGLTSVTIPSSVKYIGSKAFSSSNELTEVVWNAKSCNIAYDSYSESSHPFYSCPIIKLIVGDEVQQIPSYLMYKQIFLTSVTIPGSVTSIGDRAFSGCTNLTSVVWNAKNCSDFSSSSLAPFKDLTNIKTFEVGSEVERIPAYLCSGLTGLTSVTIPNSVTSIGRYAFSDCTGLNSVTWNAKNCNDFSYSNYAPFNSLTNIKSFEFGNEVEKIPADLCYGLTGLTSVTIPNSVTKIGDAAFYGCSGLTSVTIPNSVTSIGAWAFEGCSGLKTLIWNAENCNIKTYKKCYYVNHYECYIIYNASFFKCPIETLIFGNEVKTIPSHLMSIDYYEGNGTSYYISNKTLTAVTIGNSVTSIGDEAFYNCTGLTSVTIPNSVTSIGYDAFYYCI